MRCQRRSVAGHGGVIAAPRGGGCTPAPSMLLQRRSRSGQQRVEGSAPQRGCCTGAGRLGQPSNAEAYHAVIASRGALICWQGCRRRRARTSAAPRLRSQRYFARQRAAQLVVPRLPPHHNIPKRATQPIWPAAPPRRAASGDGCLAGGRVPPALPRPRCANRTQPGGSADVSRRPAPSAAGGAQRARCRRCAGRRWCGAGACRAAAAAAALAVSSPQGASAEERCQLSTSAGRGVLF